MFDLYTAVVLTAILLLVITVTDILTNRLITKTMRKWSVITCLLIVGAILGEWGGVLLNGASVSLIVLHKMAKLVEFCLAPAIGVAATMAYGIVKRPKIIMILVAAHAVFECIALPYHWVFSIDAQNVYHREWGYGVYIAAFVFSIVYLIICVIRGGKEYQTGVDGVLVLTLLMTVLGIGIQFVISYVRIDYLCVAIGNMLLYSRSYKIMLQLDAVTLLLNRRCYDVAVGNMSSHARAVVLFFDINQFKLINDTYGHSVGDLCLKRVGEQLRLVYGKYGSCYRIGGDEFCVLLDDHCDDLEELNGQFCSAIKMLKENDQRMPDVALGYALYDADTVHIQKVIEEADAMMYKNKEVLHAEHPAP